MRKFLLQIALTSVLFFLGLELATRAFNLSGHTVPTKNIDGDLLLQPGTDSVWVKGGRGEIRSHYVVNKQGYNSLVDYDEKDDHKLRVAILGDSYIEGFQTDVEKSIGRQLESLYKGGVVVHEYGASGANLYDFVLAYEKFVKGRYDYAFILATDKDLVTSAPSYMGQGNKKPEVGMLRMAYYHSSTLRYLNINQGISQHLRRVLTKTRNYFDAPSHEKQADTTDLSKVNWDLLARLDDDVVFLYEEGRLSDAVRARLSHPTVRIIHELSPYHHGFDRHWNATGRLNCAMSMRRYLLAATR